ncbi:hypothetical protein BMJ28_07525 [Sinorhizobium medicae]|nr:hypothetical protein BMJ28_07525 [Sinorhizobium medicae]
MLDALLKLGPVWGGSVRSPANSDVGLVDGDLNTITVAGVYTLSGNWANTYAGVNGGTSWTDWTIVELPVVGTASNSAGFPAGAIIERGSNANGEYVRFADGTQICWGTGTTNVSTNLNNHFGSTSGASVTGNALISFPATFSNTNYSVSVFPTFRGFTVLGAYSKNGANAAVRMGVSGSTANDVPYEWSAYGRWF